MDLPLFYGKPINTPIGHKWAGFSHTTDGRKIAWNREETDACQASTPGCSIDHQPGDRFTECATW